MQPPHYAALETSVFDLQLSGRQKQSLQRQGLDLDALNVVAFHAKNLVIPQVKPRSRGAFVTPSMTEGVLLTSVEMREVFNAHAELKAMRAEDTESNRLRRYMKRLEADRMKATKQQTAKQELMERREMRQEDVAALKARRVKQRSDAAQRRIEGKIAARNAKEAQQAANHKSGRQDTESNRLRRYMKRLEADRMKATKQQTAKQELMERREMRQEDVAALKARRNLVIPQVKPRSRGAFVTPSMTEGVLLTSVEMREVFNAHAELKAMRAEDTESNRLRRYMKRLEADRMKATKQQTAKQELMERREMRQEDVAALKARRNLVIPQVKPRSRGAFVTPSMTEGVLLTSVEMREVFNAHAELKAMRAEDTESNRLRRYMKRLEADRMKATKQQTAKQELMERREMRQEDVAALKARRVKQRSDAAQRRIEGKIAARNAKEAQQAANHKSERRPAALEGGASKPQRKRRALHDITDAIQNLS
ncbi:hypothetical protein PF003_g12239 [Phytophthora fragariae]|nr:hypothetical protein PF003_g12239 [Phytophthora fragariae]